MVNTLRVNLGDIEAEPRKKIIEREGWDEQIACERTVVNLVISGVRGIASQGNDVAPGTGSDSGDSDVVATVPP
jgi:hypothetical protein